MDHSTTESYEPADELPPELLDRLKIVIPGYKLISEIARGGQGIVFKARQDASGNLVAVKVLRDGLLAGDAARERLKREVRALTAIKHANIVAMIDSGETADGRDYLVMNYVDGRPLSDLFPDLEKIDYASFDPSFLLRLFLKICDAVNAAHLVGITHRDLSPSNILVDRNDEPFILDFGLARSAFDRFFSAGPNGLSVGGQFLGKVPYASPEQARGLPDKIDIRTDVYALGVILYQILTGGQFPYEVVGSIADILNNIVQAKPLPPSESIRKSGLRGQAMPSPQHVDRALVNAAIEAIVMKALEKEPSRRYQSAGALGEEIRRYLAGQPTTTDHAPAAPAKPARFRRARTYATAAVAAGLVLVAGWRYFPRQDSPSRRPPSVKKSQAADGEQREVVARVSDLVRQAEAAPGETRRRQLAEQARRLIAPLVGDLDQAAVDVWKLAARTSIVCQDSVLATLAVEALGRLESATLEEPSLRPIRRLVDQEELFYWSTRRSSLLGLHHRAAAGDAQAMGQFGLMFLEGRDGLPLDYDLAALWSQRGATQSDGLCACNLAMLSLLGKGGVAKNGREALRLLNQAAEAGNGLAMSHLGSLCAEGRAGMPKSDRDAVGWYRKAAAVGSGRAMAQLASMCEEGRGGLNYSSLEAIEWIQKAADAGDAEGLCQLARAYLRGTIGTPSRDGARALQLFKSAARAGSVSAMRELGSLLERSRATQAPSPAAAEYWYRRAAQRGDVPAQIWMKQRGLLW